MDKVIVFDIDGTLANVSHRRQFVTSKPKNWPAWNAAMPRDTLHNDIAEMLILFYTQGYKIILASGRSEDSRDVTEKWLADNTLPFKALYMRKEKDHRQDSIVKVELLNDIRKEHGEPFLWFDDRTQVVDAIRAEGVRVLQVAPGDF